MSLTRTQFDPNAQWNTAILKALFPRIRAGILEATLTRPGRSWYLSDLARHLATTASSLQREIASLLGAGILESCQEEGRRSFRAKQSSPVFSSLHGLFVLSPHRAPHISALTKPKKHLGALAVSPSLISRYSREELYTRVWSEPTLHVAKAYGISNVGLAKVCHKLRIPLPGLGYWAKKAAGKPVPKRPPLAPLTVAAEIHKGSFRIPSLSSTDVSVSRKLKLRSTRQQQEGPRVNVPESSLAARSAVRESRYDRDKLYDEVWSQPILNVAKKYGVSDVRIGKVCRELGIPLPGRGFWTKVQHGTPTSERPPLPPLKPKVTVNSIL